METDVSVKGALRTDARPADVGVIRRVPAAWEEVIAEYEEPLLKAMVIDPSEAGRVSATHALMAFEPGFDVVSVADFEAAAEWLETFVPNVLVVSSALGRSGVAQFVAAVLAAPGGSSCRLVSVGGGGDEDLPAEHGWHAVLGEKVLMSQWLHTIRQVLRQGDLSHSQLA